MNEESIITPPELFNVAALYLPDPAGKPMRIPFYDDTISAGFPSPAEGLEQVRLSPNDYLVKEENATFFAKFRGDSLIDLNIADGDIAVVDRSVRWQQGSLVVAVVDDARFVAKILRDGFLEPANAARPRLNFGDFQSVSIWGVVTGVMRDLRGQRF